MTFRAKLLLTQLPLGVGLALVGTLAVATISSLGRHSQEILKDNYRSVLAAQRMKEAVERVDDALHLSLLGDRETARQQIVSQRQRFEVELQAQEGNITEPGEREVVRRLRSLWNDYQEKLTQFAVTGHCRRVA